jgi:hypothetical protein
MLEQRLNKNKEAESYLLDKKVETESYESKNIETESNKNKEECYECKKRNETYKVVIESLFFAGACFLSGFLTGLSF